MTNSSKTVFLILRIIAWIIFVGLLLEAGIAIVSISYAWFSPDTVDRLWKPLNLTSLYKFDKGYYVLQAALISIVAILKAIMFYLIVRIFENEKLKMVKPFNGTVHKFIINAAWLALGTGLFSDWAVKYSKWFTEKGVTMPGADQMNVEGADVWLFMTVILFVIAQVFKRGIEIQSENELTV